MQNLFFLGIILVGKEKIQNKNTKTIQKQKKIKASHFAVETVGTSMGVGTVAQGEGAGGQRDLKAPCRSQGGCKEEPQKQKGWLGPKLQLLSKRKGASGVFCS